MTGAILVGGRSSRMGRDKAAMTRDGQRVLARSIRLLNAVCGRTVLVARDAEQAAAYGGFEAAVLHESGHGMGPAGGLLAALHQTGDDVFLLACDLPFLEPSLLDRMRSLFESQKPPALVPRTKQPPDHPWQVEPLCAIWSQTVRGSLALADDAFSRKAPSMTRLACGVGAQWLDLTPEESAQLRNINTPEDLAADGGLGFCPS